MENKQQLLPTTPEIQTTPEQWLVDKIDDIFTANVDPDHTAKYSARTAYVERTGKGDRLAAVADSKTFKVANMPADQGEHTVKMTIVTDIAKQRSGQPSPFTRYLTITKGSTEKDPNVYTTVIKLADGEEPMQFTHSNAPGTEKRPKPLRDRTRDNALKLLNTAVLVPQEPRRKSHSVVRTRPLEDNDFVPRWREGMQRPAATPDAPTANTITVPVKQPPSPNIAPQVQLALNPNTPAYPKVLAGKIPEMSAAEAQRAQASYEHNRDLLGKAELGYILAEAYTSAVEGDPRLSNVKIVPIEDASRIAFARPSWSKVNQSGQHEIHIQLDLDQALAKSQKFLDEIPGGREHFAGFLGIPPQDLTPQLFHVFSIVHELGHVSEYFDNAHDPNALAQRNHAQKLSLPIGGLAASRLLDKDSDHHKAVQADWRKVSKTLSVHTIDDLIRKQHDAYRSMSAENFADRAAIDVFWRNPILIDQLMSPNLDYYRKQRVS